MGTRLEPVTNWIDRLKTTKPVNGMIRIECREPFRLPVDTTSRSVSFVPTAPTDAEQSSPQVIEGMASSTSIDSYGTEMSREALLSMQIQMERGIPVLPRHNNGLSGAIEWDQVIGRTIRAQVEKSNVANPAEMSTDQYVLRVQSQLYDDDEKAKSLLGRLTNGQQIGQSIGGWFVSVRVMTNKEDEVERVIIDEVELDHLAITRAPANPDSNGLYTLRSRLEEALRPAVEDRNIAAITVSSKIIPQLREDMSDRHILEWEDNEDGTVTVIFSTDPDGEYLYYEDNDEEMNERPDSSSTSVRAVVPFKDLPFAEAGMPWQWNTAAQDEILGDDNWKRYKDAHVWFNPEQEETKAGYKLPIAVMDGGGLKVVLRGVQAAMAALNGARGGVDIPEDQREGVYNHLVRYYKKADKEPPDLKTNLPNGGIALHDELNDTIREPDHEDIETIAKTVTTETVTIRTNLDESAETVQDDKCQSDIPMSPVDAQRSANPVNPTLNEDEPMTESDLNKIQDMLTSAVSGLAQRIQAIEDVKTTSEASAVEPPDEQPTEVEQLHVRLERAEAALSDMAAKPVRRGKPFPVQQGPGMVSAFDALIERSKADGGPPTFTAIVERHKVAIADEMGDSKLTVSQLNQLLAAGLRAAERDGLICKSNNTDWQ